MCGDSCAGWPMGSVAGDSHVSSFRGVLHLSRFHHFFQRGTPPQRAALSAPSLRRHHRIRPETVSCNSPRLALHIDTIHVC